jgi:PAS domain S-box-containing protein
VKDIDTAYEVMMRTSLDGFWLADAKADIIDVNDAYCKMIGYSRDELLKMKIWGVETIEKPQDVAARMRKIIQSGADRFETKHKRKDGVIIDLEISVSYLKDKGQVFVFVRDITEKKLAKDELVKKSQQLERKSMALREVIDQIEIEKNRIKDDVLANVNILIMPIIKKLRAKGVNRKYIDLLENRLQTLISSFSRKLVDGMLKLSPRETEVCNLIEGGGFSSKEIANFLNISSQTVERHRKVIRKKLGINRKRINLTTYLQKMQMGKDQSLFSAP